MTSRTRKILTYAGLPAFYVLSLVTFFNWTFPDEQLARRIEAEFASRRPLGKGVRLEVEHASPYWINGVELRGLRLLSGDEAAVTSSSVAGDAAAKGADSGDDERPASGATPPVRAAEVKDVEAQDTSGMAIDEVTVSIGLLSALFGTTAISFDADAFAGELSGSFSQSEQEQTIQFELDAVDVGRAPLLPELVGLPLSGSLSGEASLRFPEQKASLAEGDLSLTIDDLAVGDGQAKILKTVALPRVDVGPLALTAEATAGVLRITKLSASGRDLDLEVEGRVRLREPFGKSLLELGVRFKFADEYKNRNDMTRGLFGSDGVPGVMDLDPKVKRAKRPDGMYAWRVSGYLDDPRFTPDAAGRSGASSNRGATRPAPAEER